MGGLPLGQWGCFGQTHAIVAEIGQETVAQLRGAFDGLSVGMEPVASFLGFKIRDPDRFSRPSQVGFSDTHRADLVVVGVSFLELAQLAAFQDQSLALNGCQGAHDLEAVA